jgi:hypothetical protein
MEPLTSLPQTRHSTSFEVFRPRPWSVAESQTRDGHADIRLGRRCVVVGQSMSSLKLDYSPGPGERAQVHDPLPWSHGHYHFHVPGSLRSHHHYRLPPRSCRCWREVQTDFGSPCCSVCPRADSETPSYLRPRGNASAKYTIRPPRTAGLSYSNRSCDRGSHMAVGPLGV